MDILHCMQFVIGIYYILKWLYLHKTMGINIKLHLANVQEYMFCKGR